MALKLPLVPSTSDTSRTASSTPLRRTFPPRHRQSTTRLALPVPLLRKLTRPTPSRLPAPSRRMRRRRMTPQASRPRVRVTSLLVCASVLVVCSGSCLSFGSTSGSSVRMRRLSTSACQSTCPCSPAVALARTPSTTTVIAVFPPRRQSRRLRLTTDRVRSTPRLWKTIQRCATDRSSRTTQTRQV